jgi:hypothetical protein
MQFWRFLVTAEGITTMTVLKRFAIPVATAVAALTAVASPALGSTTTAGPVSRAATPLANTSYIFYTNNEENSFTCAYNTEYAVFYPSLIKYVENNCSVRIFLHQYSSGGGASFCINAKTPDQEVPSKNDWREVTVTDNHDNC